MHTLRVQLSVYGVRASGRSEAGYDTPSKYLAMAGELVNCYLVAQMASHKPRYRTSCVDLLHSYLVNLALQVKQPAAATVEGQQPPHPEPTLTIVWLAAAAVSLVQQVCLQHKSLCSATKSQGPDRMPA